MCALLCGGTTRTAPSSHRPICDAIEHRDGRPVVKGAPKSDSTACVHVLDDKDAAWLKHREETRKCQLLVAPQVTAIVDDDVGRAPTQPGGEFAQLCLVRLIGELQLDTLTHRAALPLAKKGRAVRDPGQRRDSGDKLWAHV
eukprot:7390410-Prymnesium_polylepis.2